MKLLEGINVNVSILQQIIVELINFKTLLASKMCSAENIVMRENLAVLPQLWGSSGGEMTNMFSQIFSPNLRTNVVINNCT